MPLLEAEEVGNVTRHVRKVDVSDAELAGAGFGNAHLGQGRFSLT